MEDFEKDIRAAFDAELTSHAPAPNLRQRIIQQAVASGDPMVALRTIPRRPWSHRWMRLGALAAATAVVALAGGLYARNAYGPPPTAVHPSPAETSFGPMEAFGKLPAPALARGQGGFGGGGPSTLVATGPVAYYGPANLSWAGKLPSLPANAPVYRYLASDPFADDALAARLGATLSQSLPSTELAAFGGTAIGLREYRGPGPYDLVFGLSTLPGNPVELTGVPVFAMVYSASAPPLPTRQGPSTAAAAKAAAASFLGGYGLTPAWSSKVSVAAYWSNQLEEPIYAVQYQRLVDLGGGLKAGLVDSLAQPFGLRVDVAAGGTVVQVTGLPPVSAQPATYPLESGYSAVQAGITAPPLDSNRSAPAPIVALTQVQVVYSGVLSGAYAYLEPAYLFTGLFGPAGGQQQKIVLVPAIGPADRQP
jgi:hypothetical protein